MNSTPFLQLISCCMLILCIGALSAEEDFWNEESPRALLSAMSDEEIVAQVFMVGWSGIEPTQELLRWISERNIGGVKIFGWNGTDVESLARAIADMQGLTQHTQWKIPLLVATDQEGGWVRHIKDTTSITPGNLSLGASHLPYDAYQSAYYIGMELRAIGVNMNFAPTVDVYVNPQAHVIGPRAFSSDPQLTATLGSAFLHGMQRAGVIATAKHYPGHGNTEKDSHGTLPEIHDSLEILKQRDLLPFRVLIKEGLMAVLVGHLRYPRIHSTASSVSSFFLQELLREEMHYQGIIVTDDMYMGGAQAYAAEQGWNFATLVLESILAGSDMILLSRTPPVEGTLWRTMLNAFRNDPEARARITDAASRILTLKKTALDREDAVPLIPNIADLRNAVPNQEGKSFFFEQAARSVTVLRAHRIPFTATPSDTILLAAADPDFIRSGKKRYPHADVFRFQTHPSIALEDRDAFRNLVKKYDAVIFCLSDQQSATMLQEIERMSVPLFVISTLTPVYLLQMEWIASAIAVYGWGEESFDAGFAVLNGDYEAEGVLPLHFKF